MMSRNQHIEFITWALPKLSMRYKGFRKVKRQVCRKIDQRMRTLDLPGLDDYKQYLISNQDEWHILDQFCRIHISRFFRDGHVFTTMISSILPDLGERIIKDKNKILSVWSLGCASGEEAYTFKIIWDALLQDQFPGVLLKILGTDIDKHMLVRARNGKYPKSSLKELPHQLIEYGFDTSGENYALRGHVKENIEFLHQDVRQEMPQNSFHLIACRNLVFTYYDFHLQRRLAQQLIKKLTPGGVLLLGKNESLPDNYPELVQNKRCKLAYHKVEIDLTQTR
jgi:chemotaxis protein methyltransferase CheR